MTTNNNLHAFKVNNLTGTPFVVYGDGRTVFNTSNNNLEVIKINNLINSPFVVRGNGQTFIGNPVGGTYRLNINAGTGEDGLQVRSFPNTIAIDVFNQNLHQIVFRVNAAGNTSIGGQMTTITPYMLTVNGKIGAREVLVSLVNPWPDFVFEKNYKLKSLEFKEKYVTKNKHLLGMPSVEELEGEELNLNVGEMQGKTVQQIEEIYLHLFEMKKEINELRKENAELKKLIKK